MTYMLFALSVLLAGGAAVLAVQAFRSEHLMAYRHRGGEFFLFERGADERYRIIPVVQAPAAVWRYGHGRARAMAGAAPRVAMRHLPGQPLRALHRT
ncbi:MAG TPA: hypothetical protein VHG51_17845 [Longimicrobiaceae bacterium]|nr:hypothetical protein [Longimicrobiaceae bacterium]